MLGKGRLKFQCYSGKELVPQEEIQQVSNTLLDCLARQRAQRQMETHDQQNGFFVPGSGPYA